MFQWKGALGAPYGPMSEFRGLPEPGTIGGFNRFRAPANFSTFILRVRQMPPCRSRQYPANRPIYTDQEARTV